MKKNRLYRSLSLLTLFLSSACLVSYLLAFSWFIQEKIVESKADGYAYPDYFAYGKGTESSPYGIANKRHLYNLSWLQYLGKFDDKTYYFELAKDIDMEEMEIPPIGTESHPFKGSFDGKNYVVKNAKIVDTLPSRHPVNVTSSTFTSPQILGFFGCIGENPLSTSSSSSSSSSSTSGENPNAVKDFYLDNVEIASTGTNVLSGLIAGYVGGNLTNAGVHYGKLTYAGGTTNLNNFSTISHYSLIGDYDEKKYEWTDKPGDVGYGASLDIEDFYSRTSSILGASDGGAGKYQYLPFKGTGEKRSDSYTFINGKATYVGQSAATGNIGYYTGSSLKTNLIDVTKLSQSYYTIFDSSGSISSNYIYTKSISKDDDLYKQTKGRTYSSNKARMIRLQNGLESFDANSGDRTIVVKDAVIGGTTYDHILIPARCIWVKPSQAGALRFVIVATDSTHNMFSLRKLTRDVAGDLTSGWKDSAALAGDEITLPSASSIVRIDGNDRTGSGTGMTAWTDEQKSDVDNKRYFIYVFEHAVTKDDIENNVEYALTNQHNGNGAYFWYLDLGQNGSSGDIEGSIEKVDFIVANDDGTLVKIGDSAYTASNVLFSISGTSTSAVTYSFRRPSDSVGVLYYPSSTTAGTVITAMGSGTSGQASGEDCKKKSS